MKFLAAIFLFAAACGAYAGEPYGSASQPAPNAVAFRDLDVDRDGLLNMTEAAANPRASNSFNALDRNADGMLSAAEYTLIFQ